MSCVCLESAQGWITTDLLVLEVEVVADDLVDVVIREQVGQHDVPLDVEEEDGERLDDLRLGVRSGTTKQVSGNRKLSRMITHTGDQAQLDIRSQVLVDPCE